MLVRLYDLPESATLIEKLSREGVRCRRAESYERRALVEFVRQRWPNWVDETEAAFSHVPPTMFLAQRGAAVIGFAAYHATRPGFFGPTGVDDAERGHGAGRTLLWLCLEAMRAEGYAYAIIGGVHGRESFYEESVGATVIAGSEPGIYGGSVSASGN